MANQKNQGNQLNRITLSEAQKKQLEIKHERVRKTLLERGIVKSKAQLNDYSVYKSLDDYSKYCLLGNNYWVIMNGDYDRFVPVPLSDGHFWYYFNETCFVECDNFQRRKKLEREEKLFKIDDNKITEPEKKIEITKEPEPELKVEKKEEEMPIEENKDFLNQKQEHPKYDKEEIKKRFEVKKDNSDNTEKSGKKETESNKKEEDKKAKKTNKKNNSEQGSLF